MHSTFHSWQKNDLHKKGDIWNYPSLLWFIYCFIVIIWLRKILILMHLEQYMRKLSFFVALRITPTFSDIILYSSFSCCKIFALRQSFFLIWKKRKVNRFSENTHSLFTVLCFNITLCQFVVKVGVIFTG